MPAPGYTWKTTPDLNEKIYQEHRHQAYDHVAAELNASYQQLMALNEGHSDEELFTKKRYKWTGSTSLGSYAVSASSTVSIAPSPANRGQAGTSTQLSA